MHIAKLTSDSGYLHADLNFSAVVYREDSSTWTKANVPWYTYRKVTFVIQDIFIQTLYLLRCYTGRLINSWTEVKHTRTSAYRKAISPILDIFHTDFVLSSRCCISGKTHQSLNRGQHAQNLSISQSWHLPTYVGWAVGNRFWIITAHSHTKSERACFLTVCFVSFVEADASEKSDQLWWSASSGAMVIRPTMQMFPKAVPGKTLSSSSTKNRAFAFFFFEILDLQETITTWSACLLLEPLDRVQHGNIVDHLLLSSSANYQSNAK